jgi:hypothetical protein
MICKEDDLVSFETASSGSSSDVESDGQCVDCLDPEFSVNSIEDLVRKTRNKIVVIYM